METLDYFKQKISEMFSKKKPELEIKQIAENDKYYLFGMGLKLDKTGASAAIPGMPCLVGDKNTGEINFYLSNPGKDYGKFRKVKK